MEFANEKLAIIDWLLKQDNIYTIDQINVLIGELESEKKDSSKIVGHTPRGLRVSKTMLVQRIVSSLESLKNEPTVELNDLEGISEQW
jgi:hypothetical protein